MAFIPKCDKCSTVYEKGFQGAFRKGIDLGGKSFDMELKIRPNHVCNKCLSKLLKDFVKDIKQTYKPIKRP